MTSVRKFLTYFSPLLLLLTILPGCSSPLTEVAMARSDLNRELAPQVSPEGMSTLTRGNSEFAFDLYQALRGQDGNLFLSPYSISTALAMVYGGARAETERQMAQALRFTLPQEQLHPAINALALKLDQPTEAGADEESFQLEVANSLWGQQGYEIRDEFLDLIAANYGAGLRLVDFIDSRGREQARSAINQWVSDQTAGKIEELIGEGVLTELTRLVLANAIYFKAEWETPFLNGTKEADFTLLDGERRSVPLMSRRAGTPYAEGVGYQAVEIPYKGDRASMVVVLPQPGQFEAVENSFSQDLIEEINQALGQADVKLYLPRFAYESSFQLNQVLAELGMSDAFDPNRADFTGISLHPDPRLYIAKVLHEAFVSVDEMGTEAAASTGLIIEYLSMPVTVKVDRPFLFYIVDRETGTILFMGRVLDPVG